MDPKQHEKAGVVGQEQAAKTPQDEMAECVEELQRTYINNANSPELHKEASKKLQRVGFALAKADAVFRQLYIEVMTQYLEGKLALEPAKQQAHTETDRVFVEAFSRYQRNRD